MRPNSHTPRLFSGTLLCGVALLAAMPRSGTEPVRAIFAQVDGEVLVDEAAREKDETRFRRASRFTMVGAGDRIRVAQEGGAALICSNDRWLDLPAGTDRIVDEAFCSVGRPVAEGDFAALADLPGPVRTYRGILVLERPPRGAVAGDGLARLLSPRNTAVLVSRPELVWTRVPGARSYRVRVDGGVTWQQVVDSGQCGSNAFTCALSWPDSAGLAPDTAVEIEISATDQAGRSRSEPRLP